MLSDMLELIRGPVLELGYVTVTPHSHSESASSAIEGMILALLLPFPLVKVFSLLQVTKRLQSLRLSFLSETPKSVSSVGDPLLSTGRVTTGARGSVGDLERFCLPTDFCSLSLRLCKSAFFHAGISLLCVFTSLNFFTFDTTFCALVPDDSDEDLALFCQVGISAVATFSAMGAFTSSTPGRVVILVRLPVEACRGGCVDDVLGKKW